MEEIKPSGALLIVCITAAVLVVLAIIGIIMHVSHSRKLDRLQSTADQELAETKGVRTKLEDRHEGETFILDRRVERQNYLIMLLENILRKLGVIK